ncbi:FAD-dependent monooxygenase [Pseudomonas sp. NA-150]|uniref:FAD-dependent monooxygenase n=1 Tax=Pseudomonas sp. NA-150 TaxID=3367525 RepID=UPI0037C96910
MSTLDILIAGAGTTGLMLALRLARAGVPFRIIERNREPGRTPPTMVAQALAIEFYQQIVLAEQLIEDGICLEPTRWGNLGRVVVPSPFVLSFPQDDHDDCLLEQLRALGVEVEWNVALQHVEQRQDYLTATLLKNGVHEVCEVSYVCGCEGARGLVRSASDLKLSSAGIDDQLFYVADVTVDGPQPPNVYVRAAPHNLILTAPVRSGMRRLVGIVAPELEQHHGLTFDDMRASAEQMLGVTVGKAHWMSTYRVHQRVAEAFRVCLVMPRNVTSRLRNGSGTLKPETRYRLSTLA